MTLFEKLQTGVNGLAEARRLASHDQWSPAQLASYGHERLLALLDHARTHSPFYRDRLAGVRLGPDLELASLPPLDKATMLENFDELVTDRRLHLAELERHLTEAQGDPLHLGEYRIMATGGTTGRRGLFAYSRSDWREVIGGMLRWTTGFLGLAPRLPRRRRIAAVAADTPLHMTARMGASVDLGMHCVLRLDARSPLDELARNLEAFRPEALIAYPSSAAMLAEEQLAGRLRIAPQIVCTTSEVRTAEMEERIVAAWGVQPYNSYASTETGILAVDCGEHRGLHALTDQTLLEVVDADGRPVSTGNPGSRILVTSLVNRTQPLVRYELTDLVTLTHEPCPCGRPFPRILALDGRSDDILALPSAAGGTALVHPLALRSPLAKVVGLRQYRLVHDADGITVEVVVTNPAAVGEIIESLRGALARQGVTGVPLRVAPVAAIARHRDSGKLKLIESRVPRTGCTPSSFVR
jgi:phenylacetate-coenzyme A ligase PaaK-like adenylate-forming protein